MRACNGEGLRAHMRSMMVMRIPPPLPSRKRAAAGGTSPSLASVYVMGRSSASADRPRQVASVKGMQNLGPITLSQPLAVL